MADERRNEHERRWAECVVHDLRQPASAVRLAATLLENETTPERRARLVTMIVRNTELLDRLAADLLEALTTSRAGFSLRAEPADLGQLAREAAESCAFASSRRVKLVLEGDLPFVRVDRGRIAQVFANLLRNADQHAVAGTPLLVSVRRAGDDLEARVENQGVLHDARASSGLGLGVKLCRAIIEAHGGRIWLEERQGKVRAVFRLPVHARTRRRRTSAMNS